MMTVAGTNHVSLPLAPAVPASRTMFWAATILVGSAFLATEHDFRVSLSESYSATLDEMEQAAGGGNVLRRAAFLALGAFGLLNLALPSPRELRFSTIGAAAFIFFLGWSGLSFLWSDDPGMTVRRLMVLGCFVLGSIGLARRFSAESLMALCVTVAMGNLALGVAAELALGTFRPWAGDYRFSGSQHPNTSALSLSAICIAAFCWWRSSRRKLGPLVLFAIGFGFLILTKSRTSAAGVLASLLFLWTLSTPLRIKVGVVLSGVWMLGLAAIVILLSGLSIEEDVSRIALMGREEQSESLTGRLPIWTELAPHLERRLLIGYGFDSYWTADNIDHMTREMQWPIREAHSSYIDLVLNVGILAGTALLIGIFSSMRRRTGWFKATQLPGHSFFLGLQLFCLINALTESAMVMPLFVPFVAACGLAQSTMDEFGVGSADTRQKAAGVRTTST